LRTLVILGESRMKSESGQEEAHEKGEKQVEVQLGGRHLALALAGFAIFGVVLFLLGRWSQRMVRPEETPTVVDTVEGAAPGSRGAVADPAAPRDLTFYETLGKKGGPGLADARKALAESKAPEAAAGSTAAPVRQSSPGGTPRAAPKQAPASSVRVQERYRVQVAATRNPQSARDLANRLRKRGFPTRIETARTGDGRSQYKVQVGDFDDRGLAAKMAARIRAEEKVGAWIVKERG